MKTNMYFATVMKSIKLSFWFHALF